MLNSYKHFVPRSITTLQNNQIYQMGSTCQKCLISESEIPARDKVKDLSMYEQQRMLAQIRPIETERQSKVNIQSAALKISQSAALKISTTMQVESKQNKQVYDEEEGPSINEHNRSISSIKQQLPLQQELPPQINKEQEEDEENMNLNKSQLYVLAFKSELKSKMVLASNNTLKNKLPQLYLSQNNANKFPQNPQKQVNQAQAISHPKEIRQQTQSQDDFVLLDPVFDQEIQAQKKVNIVQVKQNISSEVQPIVKAQKQSNKFISNI